MTELHITVHKSLHDKYYFRVRLPNDEILLTSKNYRELFSCLNDIYVMQAHQNYSVGVQVSEQTVEFRFVLEAPGERILAFSGWYSDFSDRYRLMRIVREGLPYASVLDHTAVRFFRQNSGAN